MAKTGRNDPCPCGSGKKYKHCCQSDATVSVAQLNGSSEAEAVTFRIEQAKQLHQQGELAEALQLYESVLHTEPAHADALHFSGVIAYQRKNYPLAEQLMQRSITENPDNAFYYSNLGMLYKDLGKSQLAVDYQQKAIRLKPDYPEALLNLGSALVELKQLESAADCFQKALAYRPNYVEAHDNLGTTCMLRYQYDAAIACFKTALAINPNYIPSYLNLAAVHISIKQFDVVVENSLKALERDVDCASAYYYLGAACVEQNRFPEADQFLRRSIELDPENSNAIFLLGLLNLGCGNLEQGWVGYEHRWSKKVDRVARRNFTYPYWAGETLSNKTILVWGEQGVGDQIMYAGMYADLLRLAQHCIFACAKKLVPLFASSFPLATVIDIEDQAVLTQLGSSIDVQSAAGSLARWLRPTVGSFPRAISYLTVDPERVLYWKKRLRAMGPERNVGISWRSGIMTGERSYYCSAIEQWAPILAIAGIRFINLQYDDCTEELAKVHEATGVTVQVFNEVDLFDDMAESAALTSALDLVISGGTASGILSAAMGVPTWMLLSGFNWQSFGTEHILWYGSLQTVNKTWEQGWEAAIAHIATQLRLSLTAKP